MYRLRQMAATSSVLDAPTKELIIEGVVRERLPDAMKAAVVLKLVRKVLLDGLSIEEATHRSAVAAEALKGHVEAVLVEMDKAAKQPRTLPSSTADGESTIPLVAPLETDDADAPGSSRHINDLTATKPGAEPSEVSPKPSSDSTRTVAGFSYTFVLRLPNGLDMYRCVNGKVCSVLMFMNLATGEVQFQNAHTHDAAEEKTDVALNPAAPSVQGQESTSADGQGGKRRRPLVHRCEECGKMFRDKTHLRDHQLTHTGDKPFECEQCGRKYSKRSHLNIHQRVHSGEKPHVCDRCGHRFTRRGQLTEHAKSDCGSKAFACEQCPKAFTSLRSLFQHRSIHDNAQAHVCDVCGKRMSRATDLKKHKRSHTGERPHECDVCHEKFAWTSSLSKHMNRKHKEVEGTKATV